jgi:hypothetical protein
VSADQAARAPASSTSPGGVWAPERRALTVGLVLAVTPDPEVIAGIRLVTSSPALRGQYLRALSIMQYELAAAITERTGAAPAGDTFFTRAFSGAVTAAVQAASERWLFADPPVALAPLIEHALRDLADGMLAVLPPRPATEPDDEGRPC